MREDDLACYEHTAALAALHAVWSYDRDPGGAPVLIDGHLIPGYVVVAFVCHDGHPGVWACPWPVLLRWHALACKRIAGGGNGALSIAGAMEATWPDLD